MIVNYYDYSDFDENAESEDDELDTELDSDFESFDWWDDEKEVYWKELSHYRYNHSAWEDLLEAAED